MDPQIYKSVSSFPKIRSILGKEVDRFKKSVNLLPQNSIGASSHFFAGIKSQITGRGLLRTTYYYHIVV